MPLDAGPNTPLVVDLFQRLAHVLFRPQSKPAPGFSPIDNYAAALALARGTESSPDDEEDNPWIDLRVHHAAGLGEVGEPALPLTDKRVDTLFNISGDFIFAYLPAVWHDVLDDVTADLSLCAQWLALHGEMPVLPAMTVADYLAGGWPCGWEGPFPYGGLAIYYPQADQAPLAANSTRVEKIEQEQTPLRERLELLLEL